MKRITYIILAGMMVLSLSNCKKFLDVKPQGAITESDLATPDNVDGLVIAAYAWYPHEGTLGRR